MFQHIPWFINNIDENNEYFNLEKSLRQKMLDKLHTAGKECFIFNNQDIILTPYFIKIMFNSLKFMHFQIK